jgi:hypothetical protein
MRNSFYHSFPRSAWEQKIQPLLRQLHTALRDSTQSVGPWRAHAGARARGVVLLLATCGSLSAAAPAGEDPAYTRTITERAEKLVAPLGLADADKATRVRDTLVDQYRNLSRIHDALEAKLREPGGPSDPTLAEAWRNVAQQQADQELFALHRTFVARLAAELSCDEVDQVKDGMTYGVVPITYRGYQELLPELTPEQKSQILAWLIEAREYAMDAGSAEKKHWWFGKYKGRINNYLSAAGYDLRKAEQARAARQDAKSNP